MVDKAVTDFPVAGDTRRVSLRTSRFRAFDLRFALDLRKNYPELWVLGSPLMEVDRFDRLIPIQRRGGSIRNADEEAALREREKWAETHAELRDLPGVVAQIRWLVIGKLGIDLMKALVKQAQEPGDFA